jgi:tetratricopeptide (TPR) repeat protein
MASVGGLAASARKPGKGGLMARYLRFLFAVPLAAFALPAAVQAQDAPLPMYELPTITVSVLSEADPLYETASGLYQSGDWKSAAELYREAAEGMPHNDPNSYISYDMSARLYFYAGEFTDSREMMERAAGVAEATGDVVSAAYRHVDAAFIAVWGARRHCRDARRRGRIRRVRRHSRLGADSWRRRPAAGRIESECATNCDIKHSG